MKKFILMMAMLMAVTAVQAETFVGRVTLVGKVYMLNRAEAGKEKMAVANVAYPIKDTLAAYEGKVVKVTGSLKADAKFATLETIDSVEVVEE
jgi:hypothetical protein